jgi:zinc transporter ZupT
MLEAAGWGLLAQSSLLVAGLLVCWVTVPTKVVGILGGFGAGAMIAAVSFDLLPEGQAHIKPWQTGVWMMLGVAVFLVADGIVEKRFGSSGAGGAMGIVVGSVVDGVPESAILGINRGRAGRPRGGSRGGGSARDAHELTDSLLVRAWGSARRRSDGPGVLLVGDEQLTWPRGNHPERMNSGAPNSRTLERASRPALGGWPIQCAAR